MGELRTRADPATPGFALALAVGVLAVMSTVACASDPARLAVEAHVEGYEAFDAEWDYEEPDTWECRSYLEREAALFKALGSDHPVSFKRSYVGKAEDGTDRSVLVRVDDRTEGDRFDAAIPLFSNAFTGADWTTCMAARFGVERMEEIRPASTVSRGHSWALRLIYENGAVYRYDATVWQSGNQTVWLHTWGADAEGTVDWAREVQRDAAARVARGENP